MFGTSRRVDDRAERGSALLVTVLVLLLVGMLALNSLKDAEQEATAGGRSRAASRTLYAADAGIQLALTRMAQSPPNLNSFDVDLADGANVQSRERTDGAPKDIQQVSLGTAQEGYALNVEGGATSISKVYQVNVTATYTNAAVAELEARLNRTEVVATGY
jgi:Tfp pilus assembly protein PilX